MVQLRLLLVVHAVSAVYQPGHALYWVTQRLPQIYTANHATFPRQIRKIVVQICGNFWVTQHIYASLLQETVFSPVSQSQLSVGGSSTLDIELNFKHLALDSPTKVNHTDVLEHHEREEETGISSPSAPIEDVVSRQLSIGSKMDSIVKVKMGEVGTPDLFFQTPGIRD